MTRKGHHDKKDPIIGISHVYKHQKGLYKKLRMESNIKVNIKQPTRSWSCSGCP